MRVLVTGAAGFIGRHVTSALGEAGHEVYGLDIQEKTPYQQVINDGGGWHIADITKPIRPVKELDVVIHLAAIASPRECDADPARAFAVNVDGTYQVLKMALESGARKIVFSSSAHVYGIPPKYLPTDESHLLWLQNNYTATKILGEQLCDLFYRNHGLSYITLRLYNAYGPGQARGYFIPDMLAKARDGLVSLKGAATTKDWVYIDDVAQAFVRTVDSEYVGPVNIGTQVETQLATIAGIIAKQMGANLETPDSLEKTTRMCADRGRAKRVLGWKPTIGVEEGLRAVIAGETKVAVH